MAHEHNDLDKTFEWGHVALFVVMLFVVIFATLFTPIFLASGGVSDLGLIDGVTTLVFFTGIILSVLGLRYLGE